MLQCMYQGLLKWSYSLTQSDVRSTFIIQKPRIHMNEDILLMSLEQQKLRNTSAYYWQQMDCMKKFNSTRA